MRDERYTVRLVRGIAMGAGMYAVFDGDTGKQIGEAQCWRDDADRVAERLNIEDRAGEQK